MQGFHILPEHIWSKLAKGNGKAITTFQNGAPMVSGGPFELTKYTKDQLALFSRNPNWWGKVKPKIGGFGLQMFANGDAMVTALKTGQVDMIGESTQATAVKTLKSAGMVVDTGRTRGSTTSSSTPTRRRRTTGTPQPGGSQSVRIRDGPRQMVKTAWLGFAQPGGRRSSHRPPAGTTTPITAASLRPAKANAILDGLGYAKGANGIRVANGHPMSYEVIFPTEINGAGDRMFQIIQTGFKQIGVESDAQDGHGRRYYGDHGADNKYTGYDLAMWDWIPPVDPDFSSAC